MTAPAKAIDLRDGRAALVRPIAPTDFAGMAVLWSRLSAATIHQRFFGPAKMDESVLRDLVNVDGHNHVAVVAELAGAANADRALLGVARFQRLAEDPTTAEFAVTVADGMQGKGVGRALLAALVEAAAAHDVMTLSGQILATNDAMLATVRSCGCPVSERDYGDSVLVLIKLN